MHMTARQVAERLQCSTTHAAQLMKSGKFKHVDKVPDSRLPLGYHYEVETSEDELTTIGSGIRRHEKRNKPAGLDATLAAVALHDLWSIPDLAKLMRVGEAMLYSYVTRNLSGRKLRTASGMLLQKDDALEMVRKYLKPPTPLIQFNGGKPVENGANSRVITTSPEQLERIERRLVDIETRLDKLLSAWQIA